jgi:sec-independent protein translocase protein TatA
MFQNFSITEVLLILVIIVMIFGFARINKIAKELGSTVRAFREGMKGEEKAGKTSNPEED